MLEKNPYHVCVNGYLWLPRERSTVSTADEPEQSVGTLAIGGAVVVLLRSAGIAGFALIGNVVLARLLLPSEFGLVAFGITLVAAGTFLAEGGMAIGYVRRSADPTLTELRALFGLQLVLASFATTCLVALSLPFGEAGRVTAFMVLSLPILAFRTPGFILLERALDFRRLVAVEISEAVVYYAWAIAAVWVGWGVWGFASATLVRAVVGTVAMFQGLSSVAVAAVVRMEHGTEPTLLRLTVPGGTNRELRSLSRPQDARRYAVPERVRSGSGPSPDRYSGSPCCSSRRCGVCPIPRRHGSLLLELSCGRPSSAPRA